MYNLDFAKNCCKNPVIFLTLTRFFGYKPRTNENAAAPPILPPGVVYWESRRLKPNNIPYEISKK